MGGACMKQKKHPMLVSGKLKTPFSHSFHPRMPLAPNGALAAIRVTHANGQNEAQLLRPAKTQRPTRGKPRVGWLSKRCSEYTEQALAFMPLPLAHYEEHR